MTGMAATAAKPVGQTAVTDWHPSLTNEDLEPVPVEQRTWNWFSYAALWMGMVHNVVAFSIIGGMIAAGMSGWQALFAVGVGGLIQLGLLTITGRVGARHGITFAVWSRSAFGVYGANVPALIRGAVAIAWGGVQIFLGATALNALLGAVFTNWTNLHDNVAFGVGADLWIAMIAFWLIHYLVFRHGMETIRRFETWAGPLVILVMVPLTIWAIAKAGGIGPVFDAKSKFDGAGAFIFGAGGLLAAVAVYISGSWSTMVLNYPDLTRFARSNREQSLGTLIGLPVASVFFYGMATIVVSCTQEITGKALWNPADILVVTGNRPLIAIGAILLIIATLSVNVAANLVSPAYDITNLAPRIFTFRRAGYLAITLAFVYMPWKLMEDADTLFKVLNNVGAFLGPATGILLVDYLAVRRQRLDVDDLYRLNGRYHGYKGFNIPALAVLVVATVIVLVGEFADSVAWLYTYSWFTGLALGAILYSLTVLVVKRVKDTTPEYEVAGTLGHEAAPDS
jgi:NCS1 family nucleobase:cation symporter-1